jgi:methylmalonyl-CoA mutase C-terminal domain/subunit
MNHRVIRVLVGKAGLDGHDKGALLLASRLRNTGMEVIYSGLRQTVNQIIATAIQEDVDVIGISILSGAHLSVAGKLIARMEQEGIMDKRLMMGGFIPDEDIPHLKALGVTGVFTQGASFDDIVAFIRDVVVPKERS